MTQSRRPSGLKRCGLGEHHDGCPGWEVASRMECCFLRNFWRLFLQIAVALEEEIAAQEFIMICRRSREIIMKRRRREAFTL